MRKVREAKAKADSKTTERERSWSKAKDMDKAEIARLADEAKEKAEFEARVRKNSKAVNKAAVVAAAKFTCVKQ